MNIVELKRSRADLVQKMTLLNQKDGFDEADSDEFGRLKAQVDSHDSQIADHAERLKCLEDLNQKSADTDEDKDGDADEDADSETMSFKPAVQAFNPSAGLTRSGQSKMVIKQPPRRGVPPGTNFATMVMALGLEKKFGMGAGIHWLDTCHKQYDHSVKKALASNSPSMAGFQVPVEFVAELIPVLRSRVLTRLIGPRVYPMDHGNLTFPRQSQSVLATWLPEVGNSSYSQLAGDTVTMTARKLMALTSCTNDLIRRSALSAEALIRDDLLQQISRSEDSAYLMGGVTTPQTAPVGLINQIAAVNQINAAMTGTALNAAATTTWLSASTAVLTQLILLIKMANVDTAGLVWLLHPLTTTFLSQITDQVGNFVYRNEIAMGSIWGYKFYESNILPTNLGTNGFDSPIFLVQPDELIIGDSLNVSVDSTSEGAYIDGTGTMRSTFSADQTAFRVIKESDFAMRHPTGAAVAYVSGWAPLGFAAYSNSVTYSTQTLSNTVTSSQAAAPGISPGP